MQSSAANVDEYLAELPDDRRGAIIAVRQVILDHLPDGYEEAMNWGMIVYQIPLEVCPDTYNGQPLVCAALASQKRYMSVYLAAVYSSEETRREFEAAYKASGKRFDCGRSCVRFRKLDDLPLDVLGNAVASVSVDELIHITENAHAGRRRSK